MKKRLKTAAVVIFCSAVLAEAKTLTTDPLTSLPLYPATDKAASPGQ